MSSPLQPAAPSRIGGYALAQILGHGGMGEVYLAEHLRTGALLALKLARRELIDDVAIQVAFEWELATTQSINHPHLVRVHALGVHERRPYLVMDLMTGGTLAQARPKPQDAVRMMMKIASAVAHAHVSGILHCDLKPSNILLDEAGEPHVSDFGLARALEQFGDLNRTSVEGGSWGWMAPEQMLAESLTAATDVFALGLLLWWMLTGEHPFGREADFRERVLHQAPDLSNPAVPWELRAICQRALQRLPKQRYQTAADLESDLSDLVALRPILAERNRPLRRVSKWTRRHLLVAVLLVEALLLLVYLALIPLTVVEELRGLLRNNNLDAALSQAGEVANELQLQARSVRGLAADPSLSEDLARCDLTEPSQVLRRLSTQFDNVWGFKLDGALCRSAHQPQSKLQDHYRWRDYFVGQEQLGQRGIRDVYLARVIRDDLRNELNLVYAAPVFDAKGNHVGFVAATTKTRATFGSVRMKCRTENICLTALLGPRDRDSAEQLLKSSLTVIAEPGLDPGAEVQVPAEVTSRICRSFGCTPDIVDPFGRNPARSPSLIPDYPDPVTGRRSLAAVAPVAKTGMSVVVATPHNSVVELSEAIHARMRAWMWLPMFVGALLIALVAALTRFELPVLRKRNKVKRRL